MASPNVLVTRADIPDEVVYNITKVIWENLGTLHEIHRATRDMRMEIAIDGLGAPLHQGAIRYYREIGLDIPPRLLLEKQRIAPAVKEVRHYEFTLAALDSFSVRAFSHLLQRICQHL